MRTVAMALILSAMVGSAHAFKPTRTIEVVVHTGPGGGSDLLARAVANMIEKEKLLPVRMQVVNKTGGGGAVAAAYLAEKSGDQNTIGFFTGVWLTSPLTSTWASAGLPACQRARASHAVPACERRGPAVSAEVYAKKGLTACRFAAPYSEST